MHITNAVTLLALTGLSAADWWKPAAGISWDWQLVTPINQNANVAVYDIDMFDNTAATIASLHAKGKKVICYVSVGSWENYRPDAAKFPASVKGAKYDGFPDEKWLDIRKIDILGPIMLARFQMAKDKGCDAIEPDNMDGYDKEAHESSGFPLTYADQIVYNSWVADTVHSLGMAVGLKNDINQVKDLVGKFDFHVSEEAFQYNEQSYLTPFIAAGKPVFECEYSLALSKFCTKANALNFSSIKKKNSLNSYREACR